MHKLTVTLKQHTPLIHFQHYQEGATLRASEVKPKLDRFILTKLGGGTYKDGVEEAQKKDWLIGIKSTDERFAFEKDKQYALNYKLRFVINEEPKISIINEVKKDRSGEIVYKRDSDLKDLYPYPLFFGNLDKDIDDDFDYKRFSLLNDPFKMHVLSFNLTLLKYIDSDGQLFADFFAENNFGTRQSKGFGSFYVDKSDEKYFKELKGKIFFKRASQNYNELFSDINLFYNSLRGGINKKKLDKSKKDKAGNYKMEDVFYFKSLLFLYAKSLGLQWEKKTIKEIFFNISPSYSRFNRDTGSKEYVLKYVDLTTQQEERIKDSDNDDPLFFSHENKKIIKDLFGLSSVESWQSYNRSIIYKTEAKELENGEFVKKEEKEQNIQRIPSPILLKIIKDEDKYKIFVFIKREIEEKIKEKVLDKTFIISSDKDEDGFPLNFPAEFSYDNFFKFILSGNTFDINAHVKNQTIKIIDRVTNKPKEVPIKEFTILKDIYTQLKANYNAK